MDVMMFSLKDLGWIILGIALLALIIYLIVTFANLIKTLKKVNSVLDDVKVVSEIASNRAVAINNMVEGATEELKSFLESLSPSLKNIFQSIANRITDGGKEKSEKKKIKEAQKAAKKAAKEAARLAENEPKEDFREAIIETPNGGMEVSETTIHTPDGDVKVQEMKAAKFDGQDMR